MKHHAAGVCVVTVTVAAPVRAQRRGRVPLWQTPGDPIRQAVKDQPDATLAELRQRLGLAVALSTLWAAVAALGLTVKKKSPAPPSRTGPM